mgnify:FL=1
MNKNREPIIRTAPRMADLNMNGNIFGGWVLSQMDIASGITAAREAKGPVATVAIEAMKFLRPIKTGDVISVYTKIIKIGRTSISIHIDVMANDLIEAEGHKVTEGTFVFVAIDQDGRPRVIN